MSILRPDKASFTDLRTMDTTVNCNGLQVEIARRMGVGRRWVSRLLARAEMAMAWMADHDVCAAWNKDHIGWYLDAPVGRERKRRTE